MSLSDSEFPDVSSVSKDPVHYAQHLFGPDSSLSCSLRRSCVDPTLADRLEGWIDTGDNSRWIDATASPGSIHMAQGLVKAIRAATIWSQARNEWSHEQQAAFSSAVIKACDEFHQAFPSDAQAVIGELFKDDSGIVRGLSKAAIEHQTSSVASSIVRDLLNGWLGHSRENSWSISTPVVSVGNLGNAQIAWLTVDLFPGQPGPLVPDIRSLGLTGITTPHKTDGSFWQSTCKMWQLCGLQSKFRGRWRIERTSPESVLAKSRQLRQKGDSSPWHPAQLNGRSAEAAFLVSLLAASGDPYGEGRTVQGSDPLDSGVLITGCVNEGSPATPLELTIGPVHDASVWNKLDGSESFGLRSVLLAEGQKFSSEMEREHRDQTNQKDWKFGQVQIQTVSNVFEALDAMLETNRDLRHYQLNCRDEWMAKWQGDSGRAGDLDQFPWTEADRQRVLERKKKSM